MSKEILKKTNDRYSKIFNKPKYKIYDKQLKYKVFDKNSIKGNTNWWQRFKESTDHNLFSKQALYLTMSTVVGFSLMLTIEYIIPGTASLNTVEFAKFLTGGKPFLLANGEELAWAEYVYRSLKGVACPAAASFFKYCVGNEILINPMYKDACYNVGFVPTNDVRQLGYGSDFVKLAKESFIEYGRLLHARLVDEEQLVLDQIRSSDPLEPINFQLYKSAKLDYTKFVNEYETYISNQDYKLSKIEKNYLESSLIKMNPKEISVVDNLLILDDTTNSLEKFLYSLKDNSDISEENNISSLKSIKDKITT